MSRPNRSFNLCPRKCDSVPGLNDAYDTLPGFALIQATSSASVFAGTLGWVTSTSGASTPLITPVKSAGFQRRLG